MWERPEGRRPGPRPPPPAEIPQSLGPGSTTGPRLLGVSWGGLRTLGSRVSAGWAVTRHGVGKGFLPWSRNSTGSQKLKGLAGGRGWWQLWDKKGVGGNWGRGCYLQITICRTETESGEIVSPP